MMWGDCNGFQGTWAFADAQRESYDYIKAYCKSPVRLYILDKAAGMNCLIFYFGRLTVGVKHN